MKLAIPRAIVLVVACVLILAVFLRPLESLREEFSLFFNILAAFAFILGGASLLGVHGRKIRRRARGWGYSAVCIAAFSLTLLVGLFKLGSPAGISGSETAEGSLFAWIVDYVFAPCDATLFSLLAFFVASAAFRAFRLRSREATIMMVAAFVLLIGRTFLGSLVTEWLPARLESYALPSIVQWILSTPLTVGNRAILIGVALGTIATSLRIIIGIDKPYQGGGS